MSLPERSGQQNVVPAPQAAFATGFTDSQGRLVTTAYKFLVDLLLCIGTPGSPILTNAQISNLLGGTTDNVTNLNDAVQNLQAEINIMLFNTATPPAGSTAFYIWGPITDLQSKVAALQSSLNDLQNTVVNNKLAIDNRISAIVAANHLTGDPGP